MAITPLDIATLTAAQVALMSRARGIIDAELRLRYDEIFPVKIRRGIIDFMFKDNPAVLATLIAEYEAAGWHVTKYVSEDQGDWYLFSGQ